MSTTTSTTTTPETEHRIYSLHVGINNLSSSYPYADELKLSGCLNDCDAMASFAKEKLEAADTLKLKDHEATVDGLKAKFMDLAAIVRPGDLVFFTYSGHGAWVRDTTDTEHVNADQQQTGYAHLWFHPTIMLFDRMMMDEEWLVIWRAFPPFVRVVTMFDSCVSATADIPSVRPLKLSDAFRGFRAMVGRLGAEFERRVADLVGAAPPLKDLATFFTDTTKLPDPSDVEDGHRFRTPGREIVEAIVKKNQNLYTAIQRIFSNAPPFSVIGLHMSACTDAQVAMEAHGGGLFTRAVTEEYRKSLSYDTLLQLVRDNIRSNEQTPQLVPFGIVPIGITSEDLFTLGVPEVALQEHMRSTDHQSNGTDASRQQQQQQPQQPRG